MTSETTVSFASCLYQSQSKVCRWFCDPGLILIQGLSRQLALGDLCLCCRVQLGGSLQQQAGQTFPHALSTSCQHCWLDVLYIASMHIAPWGGHGLQGFSMPAGVMSVRACARAPSPNELIALVISCRVNRLGQGSSPKGLLGPKRVSATSICRFFLRH